MVYILLIESNVDLVGHVHIKQVYNKEGTLDYLDEGSFLIRSTPIERALDRHFKIKTHHNTFYNEKIKSGVLYVESLPDKGTNQLIGIYILDRETTNWIKKLYSNPVKAKWKNCLNVVNTIYPIEV